MSQVDQDPVWAADSKLPDCIIFLKAFIVSLVCYGQISHHFAETHLHFLYSIQLLKLFTHPYPPLEQLVRKYPQQRRHQAPNEVSSSYLKGFVIYFLKHHFEN